MGRIFPQNQPCVSKHAIVGPAYTPRVCSSSLEKCRELRQHSVDPHSGEFDRAELSLGIVIIGEGWFILILCIMHTLRGFPAKPVQTSWWPCPVYQYSHLTGISRICYTLYLSGSFFMFDKKQGQN